MMMESNVAAGADLNQLQQGYQNEEGQHMMEEEGQVST